MLEFEQYMTADVLGLIAAFKKHLKDSPSKPIDFGRCVSCPFPPTFNALTLDSKLPSLRRHWYIELPNLTQTKY
jgi:hypothetical protein